MKTQETKLGILLGVRGICLALTRLWFQPSILKKEKKNHKQKNKAKIEKMSKKSASNVKKQTNKNKNNNKTSNTSPLHFFF